MTPKIFDKAMRRSPGESRWVMMFGRGKGATRCEVRKLSEDERQGTAYRFCAYVNGPDGGSVHRAESMPHVCAWAERELRRRGFKGAPS